MKLLPSSFFLLLLMLLSSALLTGQSSAVFMPYSPSKSKISIASYNALNAKAPDYEYHSIVEALSISKLVADGKAINLSIPGIDEKARYLRIDELSIKKDTMFLLGGYEVDSSSLVTIRSYNDMVFGTIRQNNQSYTLTGIKPGISVITQNKLRIIAPYCPVQGGVVDSAVKEDFQPVYDFSKSGALEKTIICPESRLNILVMYTDAADASVQDIDQVAQSSVDQMNGFLHNSDLNLRANLVGTVAFSEFVEGDDINNDLGRLGGNISASPDIEPPVQNLVDVVQQEILRTGADYVVFLTGPYQSSVIGTSDATVFTDANGQNTFDLGPPNRLAIVDATLATEEFTFGHEVGHLMGCHHQAVDFENCNHGDDLIGFLPIIYKGQIFEYLIFPDNSGPDFAHALIDDKCRTFLGKNKAKVTVMVSNAGLDGPPILREANWNVDYKPTYSNTEDDDEGNEFANNARQIREATNEILSLGDCTPGINVFIGQRPVNILPGQSYQFSGFTSDCDGAEIYEWQLSTNGFTYSTVGTGSVVSITMPPDLQPFSNVFIRVLLRCDDGDGDPSNDPTASEQIVYLVTIDDCEQFDCLGNGSGNQQNKKASAPVIPQLNLSPNPVSNLLVVNTGGEITRLEVLNGNGSRVVENQLMDKSQDGKITIDVSEYYPGLYLIRAHTHNSTYVAKFIKQ